MSREGVKAASVTKIGLIGAAEPPVECMEIKIDKPFIYIIMDNYGLPLFVGTMVNPII